MNWIGIIALVLWLASAAFIGGLFLGMSIGAESERNRRMSNGGR